MGRFAVVFATLFLFGFVANRSTAAILYGLSDGDLLTINTTTGAATVVGALGVPQVTPVGLAIAADGAMYSTDGFLSRFISIDPATGAGETVGNGLGFVAPNSLAFDNGGTLFSVSRTQNRLYTINTVTGLGAGGAFISGGATDIQALAFDNSGTLYAAADNSSTTPTDTLLYTINPTTGASTLIGSVGFRSLGLAFDTSGTLYGIRERAGADIRELITIDIATGAGTAVGPTGITAPIGGLTYSSVVSAVPEPSCIALVGISAFGIAARVRRAKKRSA